MASLTGFFSQQLVQFKDCYEKNTTAVASISRTNSYSRIGGSFQNNAHVDFAPMVAAIHVGVIQPVDDLTNVLSSGCASGNCTFPATDGASFSTIAVSHFCQDITTRIRTVNESTNANSRNRTPGYFALDYYDNEKVEWDKEQGGIVLKTWIGKTISSGFMTIYFLFRSHWRDNYDNWKAVNCTLYPTINTHAANITSNHLEEKLIDSVLLQSTMSQFAAPPVRDADLQREFLSWSHKMTTNYTIRNGIRESCNGSEGPSSNHIRFMKSTNDATYVNSTGQTSVSAGWRWWYYPQDCVWSIHAFSAMTISDTLRGIFSDQEVFMGPKSGVEASPQMRQIFLEGNMTFDTVNERIGSLATSMTAVIRANGGNGSETTLESAKGDIWIKTTCMSMRWPWLTFPAVMIALTGVFLTLIVIENRGVEHDRLWKSSFLAALFCQVDTQNRPVGKAEMKAMAESTTVSLGGKNSGVLRLIAH